MHSLVLWLAIDTLYLSDVYVVRFISINTYIIYTATKAKFNETKMSMNFDDTKG
jgi:hypothetical protein